MVQRVMLLVSGPLAVGKSAVRAVMVSTHQFTYLRSSDYLKDVAATKRIASDRKGLQDLGDSLDAETDYRWVVDQVAVPALQAKPEWARWIFDAVRKSRQIEHFRGIFGRDVFHVHFTATEDELKARYIARQKTTAGAFDHQPFEVAIDHDNERESRSLINVADLVIDLGDTSPKIAADKIMARLE